MADLEYTVENGVATILLNRPHRKNAFTLDMLDTWADSLRCARTDPQVRVILVTGAGGAFCAGVDLDDLAEVTTTLARQEVLSQRVHRVAAAALELDKPLIAAVDGVAVGAGMDMALACDIRLASDRAGFSEAYVRVGLVPGDGGAYLLPRIVGQARALELLWTGRFVDAHEALDLGIVLSVHPPEQLAEEADLTGPRELVHGFRSQMKRTYWSVAQRNTRPPDARPLANSRRESSADATPSAPFGVNQPGCEVSRSA
jgi:enoyl-CoA hydratase/carnithine racemase